MDIVLFADAIDDYKHWKKSGNVKVQKKIEKLFQEVKRSPYEGIGKPEQLKHELSGKWSRRITQKDRMVYEVVGNTIRVYSLRGHYD